MMLSSWFFSFVYSMFFNYLFLDNFFVGNFLEQLFHRLLLKDY